MAEKNPVSVMDVLTEVRLGMTDEQIMRKHRLSESDLESMKRRLFDAALVTSDELEKRNTPKDTSKAPTSGSVSSNVTAETVEVGSRSSPADHSSDAVPSTGASESKQQLSPGGQTTPSKGHLPFMNYELLEIAQRQKTLIYLFPLVAAAYVLGERAGLEIVVPVVETVWVVCIFRVVSSLRMSAVKGIAAVTAAAIPLMTFIAMACLPFRAIVGIAHSVGVGLLTIMAFVSQVGQLLVLLWIIVSATQTLRKYRVRVGLLGARREDMDYLRHHLSDTGVPHGLEPVEDAAATARRKARILWAALAVALLALAGNVWMHEETFAPGERWSSSERKALAAKRACNGLRSVILAGNVAELRRLVSEGAEVNCLGDERVTPLMSAARSGSIETASVLLEAGATVNAVDEEGWTALFWAAKGGHIEMARWLMDKGVDVHYKDRHGQTALFPACDRKGNEEIIELLLEQGMKVTDEDNNEVTPLAVACHLENTSIVKFLLAKGAVVNWRAHSKALSSKNAELKKIIHEAWERSFQEKHSDP
jgi:hypothetical protein